MEQVGQGPWWLDDERIGPRVWEHCQSIENKQFAHHQRLLFNALKYSNREISAFDWGNGRLLRTSLLPDREGVENLVQSVVEALVATVGKNKVKARPKTKRASFKLRRSARKLDRFLYAEAKRLDFWERHKQAFEDSCWAEVGCLFWDWDDDGPCLERVFPDELIIDNDECHAEPKPLAVFRRRAVHVESVIDAWGLDGDVAAELRAESQTAPDLGWVNERAPGPGWVVVVEVHRPRCGSTPGKHVIGTKNLTLLDEPWDEDWVPYTFYHFAKPVSGFYCRSAVEMAWPYQRRLDEINAVIRDAQDLMARPRIWAPIGAKIDVRELTNRVGRIIHSAIKPEPLTWPAAPPELYNERDRVVRSCFEYFGLTQLSAQGKLPNGTRLDSSKALNEYNAIEDGRQVDRAQRYEAFQMAGFDMLVKIAERAAASGKSLKTTWVAGRRVEEIDWADVDYSKDRYVLTVEPSSTFNETLAAHFDDIAKHVQAGIITREEYLSLLQTPDSERLVSQRLAGMENIYHSIEQVESGKYVPPSPLQDLVSGVQVFHFHYLDLCNEYDDVPESVKENLKLWIYQAKWIMEAGAEFSQQADPATAGNPMTTGAPPVPGAAQPMPADPNAIGFPGMPAGPPMPTAASLVPNATQL